MADRVVPLQARPRRATGRANGGRILRRFGTLFGFLIVVSVFWSQRPETFMTVRNWLNITQQVSILGVVAFTMTVVMSLGDFDLSVGAMASLAGIVAALLFRDGQAVWIGVGAALGVGLLGGLVNGLLVSYVGISPFVATLGMLTLFSGVAFYISSGTTIFGRAIPSEFSDFARGGIPLGEISGQSVTIPNLTLLALLVLVVVWVLMEQTTFGRRLYAIGGNREAARLAGVRVRRLRLVAFMITGMGAATAGLMLVSRLASANPTQGDGLMLNAIAAVFLGMTMSEEGEPHVSGTLVGVLILGVLANGLTQMQVDSYIQQILTGAIIILAVMLSSITRRNV
ncbi:MAG: ABC transporter permease [Aggregatilineales bacterium]